MAIYQHGFKVECVSIFDLNYIEVSISHVNKGFAAVSGTKLSTATWVDNELLIRWHPMGAKYE